VTNSAKSVGFLCFENDMALHKLFLLPRGAIIGVAAQVSLVVPYIRTLPRFVPGLYLSPSSSQVIRI